MSDPGKLDLSLVPPALNKAAARAFQKGIRPGRVANGWRLECTPDDIMRSLLRHVMDLLDGKVIDPDSGLHQLDPISANVAALCYFASVGQHVSCGFDAEAPVSWRELAGELEIDVDEPGASWVCSYHSFGMPCPDCESGRAALRAED